MYCSTWNAFTNVTTQGGRQGRIKGHPKGLGKYQEGLPPKGWASTKRACPQGLGKHQECLPPRAGQAPRVPAPQGLGKGREVAVERSGVATFRAFPSPWDKQSRGLPRHLAGSLGACPALWDRQARGLPRHLCPFIQPCLPPCYPSRSA